MFRYKCCQAVALVILMAIVVSLMVVLQRGVSVDIVNPYDIRVRHGFAAEKRDVTVTTVPTTKATTHKTTTTTTTTTRRPTPAPIKNPVPDTKTLAAMNAKDLVDFYHSYVMSPQSTCSTVRRMGLVKDGGWEMCDDIRFRPNRRNCLVYSFGINYDFSYDDDMAEYGCEIHAFDPSMGNTKDHLRGKRVHFHPTGILGHDGVMDGGPPKFETWKVYTLNTHRKMLNHSIAQRRIDIVKMDVEGSELASLTKAVRDGSLKDVRQLSWETHLSLNGNPTRERYTEYINLLRSLWDAGFRIYLTSRNHVWSAFMSDLVHKQRVTCHEINMVNIKINNKNIQKRRHHNHIQEIPFR